MNNFNVTHEKNKHKNRINMYKYLQFKSLTTRYGKCTTTFSSASCQACYQHAACLYGTPLPSRTHFPVSQFFNTLLRLLSQSERPNFHFAIELVIQSCVGSEGKEHHSRLVRFMIDFGAGWHLDLALKLALVLDLEGRDDSTRRSVPKQIKPLSVSAGHVITVFKFS